MAVLAFFPFFFPTFFYIIEKNASVCTFLRGKEKEKEKEKEREHFPQRAFRTRILHDVAPSSVNGQVGQPKFAQISAPFVSIHDTSSFSSSSSLKKLRHSSIRGEKLRLNFSPGSVPRRLPRITDSVRTVHPILDQEETFRCLFPFLPCFNASSLRGGGGVVVSLASECRERGPVSIMI